LTPLAGLKNLEHLEFSNTPVSDVTPLAGLANLAALSLSDTQVSEEDIEKLKQVMPNCVVYSTSDPL